MYINSTYLVVFIFKQIQLIDFQTNKLSERLFQSAIAALIAPIVLHFVTSPRLPTPPASDGLRAFHFVQGYFRLENASIPANTIPAIAKPESKSQGMLNKLTISNLSLSQIPISKPNLIWRGREILHFFD